MSATLNGRSSAFPKALYEIGSLIPEQGIYGGPWIPPPLPQKVGPHWGKGKVYDLYVAPGDVPNAREKTFTEIAAELTDMTIMGHACIGVQNETTLHDSLRRKLYGGEYFCATIEQLVRIRPDGTRSAKTGCLYDAKNKGDLLGTFSDGPYWSISEHWVPGTRAYILPLVIADMKTGKIGGQAPRGLRGYNLRMVKLEYRQG